MQAHRFEHEGVEQWELFDVAVGGHAFVEGDAVGVQLGADPGLPVGARGKFPAHPGCDDDGGVGRADEEGAELIGDLLVCHRLRGGVADHFGQEVDAPCVAAVLVDVVVEGFAAVVVGAFLGVEKVVDFGGGD